MKKLIISIQAIHPPLLLASLCFFIFSWWIGGLSPFSFFFYLGIVGFVIFGFDGLNRYAEFQRMKKRLLNNKSTNINLFLRTNRFSWCTREMAKAACKSISKWKYKRAIVYYEKIHNFKLWDIFPVGTFKRNSVWFRKKFWTKTFFSFNKKT